MGEVEEEEGGRTVWILMESRFLAETPVATTALEAGCLFGLVFNGVALCSRGSLQNCCSLSILGQCQEGETDCF